MAEKLHHAVLFSNDIIPQNVKDELTELINSEEKRRFLWKNCAEHLKRYIHTVQSFNSNAGLIMDIITRGFTDEERRILSMDITLMRKNNEKGFQQFGVVKRMLNLRRHQYMKRLKLYMFGNMHMYMEVKQMYENMRTYQKSVRKNKTERSAQISEKREKLGKKMEENLLREKNELEMSLDKECSTSEELDEFDEIDDQMIDIDIFNKSSTSNLENDCNCDDEKMDVENEDDITTSSSSLNSLYAKYSSGTTVANRTCVCKDCIFCDGSRIIPKEIRENLCEDLEKLLEIYRSQIIGKSDSNKSPLSDSLSDLSDSIFGEHTESLVGNNVI